MGQAEKVITDLGSTRSMLEIYYQDEVDSILVVFIQHTVSDCCHRLVLGWVRHWSSLLLYQGRCNVLISASGAVTIAHSLLVVKVTILI